MNSTLLDTASTSLGCDLRDVTFANPERETRSSGLAFARHNRITLSRHVQQMTPASQRIIVAHELAHIAQKRRGLQGFPKSLFRHPTYRLLLEVDAAVATADILAGRQSQALLPDDPEAVSYWGPAGHYWTTLLVMLAAGVELNTALRRAFFCQMPDQVHEFDAISAAVDHYLPIQHIGSAPVLGKRATPPEDFYNEKVQVAPPVSFEIAGTGISYMVFPGLTVTLPWEASSSEDRRAMLNREISSGLHCLTGRRGSDEVAFRSANARQYVNNEVAFGIALHCFGDSYSHQNDSGEMYPPIMGHGLDGHAPDSMKEHQTQYLGYVGALYTLCRESFSGIAKVKLPNLLAGLKILADIDFHGNDEQINAKQSSMLREICIRMNFAPASALNYHPENEKISYWKDFHPRHKTLMAPEGEAAVFRLARALGKQWNTN